MAREARKFNKKPRTRPTKTPAEKARRLKVQRARLVKLGLDAAVVEKMQPEEIRKLCVHRTKAKKMVAAAQA